LNQTKQGEEKVVVAVTFYGKQDWDKAEEEEQSKEKK